MQAAKHFYEGIYTSYSHFYEGIPTGLAHFYEGIFHV